MNDVNSFRLGRGYLLFGQLDGGSGKYKTEKPGQNDLSLAPINPTTIAESQGGTRSGLRRIRRSPRSPPNSRSSILRRVAAATWFSTAAIPIPSPGCAPSPIRIASSCFYWSNVHGRWRTFGSLGRMKLILESAHDLVENDPMFRIPRAR